ncbi:MAG TPA: ADP-forming succinate--CoA ligase subunit beta [Candidatus Acidoferrales bacterium]|nr:ADP-forming succinate--CoA ligase subunit beta [Candidatus Acidoferrales bacterium]
MNLIEYEAKQVFFNYGIPIPKGMLISEPKQTKDAANSLKLPYMVKAQVPAGGRGKAGGVMSVSSVYEAEQAAAKLLGTQIKNFLVKQVLIEEKLPVKKELYLGITVDRFNRCYVVLASAVGGVEIEEVAEKTPKAIFRNKVDSQLGMPSFQAIAIAKQLGYSGSQLLELVTVIQKLFRTCVESDAETAEINPLVETEAGSFMAADARMVIDDNALFRHPEYEAKQIQSLSPDDTLALKHNLAYVKLDGDIGVVGNGAGLVMATLDLLTFFGGKPANFLDVGGGASTEAITAALVIVLSDSATKAVLVNVLGGITRCDEVAKGIVEAIKETNSRKPVVVRLVGTNQREGQKILIDTGIFVLGSMEEAARQAVAYAAEGKR